MTGLRRLLERLLPARRRSSRSEPSDPNQATTREDRAAVQRLEEARQRLKRTIEPPADPSVERAADSRIEPPQDPS